MGEHCVDLEFGQGRTKRFTHLVLDYTGTLSLDGVLLPGVAERLAALATTDRPTLADP